MSGIGCAVANSGFCIRSRCLVAPLSDWLSSRVAQARGRSTQHGACAQALGSDDSKAEKLSIPNTSIVNIEETCCCGLLCLAAPISGAADVGTSSITGRLAQRSRTFLLNGCVESWAFGPVWQGPGTPGAVCSLVARHFSGTATKKGAVSADTPAQTGHDTGHRQGDQTQ